MQRMTRAEILAVYEAGPEAVVNLVEMLFTAIGLLQAEAARLTRLTAAQAGQIAKLQERVKTLEDRAAKDSHNSSKPPSSDGFAKPKSRREKSGRSAGGQKGHPGHFLEMTGTPDRMETHTPSRCRGCGCDLGKTPAHGFERRQVMDLPPMKLEITEHRVESRTCPACGCLNTAAFPETVTQPAQYGPNIKALAVYLTQYQLLPYERASELFHDLFGAELSQATLVNANQACHEILAPAGAEIKEHVTAASVAHFDESGLYIGGKREWLHVASTLNATYYAAHPKRGDKATDEIGILPQFQGTAVHDFWMSYLKYSCRHGFCNAHLLRELTAILELDKQTWPQKMMDLLLLIKQTVDRQKAWTGQLDPAQLSGFEERYGQITQEGYAENPAAQGLPGKRGRPKQSKAKNLLDRFQTHRREILAFMYDFDVPFDNNQAERDIRMIKVKQKVSGTFRSHEGADAFCRIRSYISTVKKNSFPVIDAIKAAFNGKPIRLNELLASNGRAE